MRNLMQNLHTELKSISQFKAHVLIFIIDKTIKIIKISSLSQQKSSHPLINYIISFMSMEFQL